MSFKKRATKSIALALIGVTVAIPTMNTVSAMENSQSYIEVNQNNLETIEDLGINQDFIDGGVFDPSKMNESEKKAYYEAIEKQVDLMIKEYGENFDAQSFREELIFVLETENSLQSLSDADLLAGSWIPDIKIKNSVAAAAFNTAIDVLLISAGVGTVTALVKKVGVNEARKMFTRTLTSKLKAWGLVALAGFIPTCVNFVFNLLSPGSAIATFLDKNDHFKNNGYIDVVL